MLLAPFLKERVATDTEMKRNEEEEAKREAEAREAETREAREALEAVQQVERVLQEEARREAVVARREEVLY